MLSTRPSRVVVVVALAVLAIACGDPTKPKATFASALSSYSLVAFTGAPSTSPTAIDFLRGVARADASFSFDVAFDLDAAGRPVIYPVRSIAGSLAGSAKRVGLQLVTGSFDSIREAPKEGYDTLSAKTVLPGSVLAVELLDLNNCYLSLGGSTIYAKLTIDSVNTATRRLYARTVVDPNCGYRGLVADSIPTI